MTADVSEVERLQRMRHHNATTTEQRQEVIKRLAEALTENWEDEATWMTLGECLESWIGPTPSKMKDTEIVAHVECGVYAGSTDAGPWETFPDMTDEWKAELVRRYHDAELRHTVDENELKGLGLIK